MQNTGNDARIGHGDIDRGGAAQDRLGRTVVPLQPHHLGLGEVALEVGPEAVLVARVEARRAIVEQQQFEQFQQIIGVVLGSIAGISRSAWSSRGFVPGL